MAGSIKLLNIGQVVHCPEVTKGTPNWKIQASGGVQSPASVTAATGAAIAGYHNDAIDAAPAEFFSGVFVYFATGACAGDFRKVTAFSVAASVATYTLGAAYSGGDSDLSGTPAATDEIYVFAPLPTENASFSLDVEKLPRGHETLTFDKAPHAIGLKSASGSWDMEVPGLETSRDETGPATTPDRFGHLLAGLGERVVGEGSTFDTGDPHTTTRAYLVSTAGFTASYVPESGKSNLVMCEGTGPSGRSEVRRVTAVDTDVNGPYIDVYPALSNAPTDGNTAYAAVTYVPAEDGIQAYTVLGRKDDQVVELQGCLINVAGTWAYGSIAMLNIDVQATNWEIHDPLTWDGSQSDKSPIVSVQGSAFFLEAYGPDPDDAALPFAELGFDFGRERVLQKISSGHRQVIVDGNSSATAKIANTDPNIKTGATFSEVEGSVGFMMTQCGIAAGAAAALLLNGQIETVSQADQDSIGHWDLTIQHRDGDYEATPRRMLLARF